MSADKFSESKDSSNFGHIINLRTPELSQRGIEKINIQKLRRKSHLVSDKNFLHNDIFSQESEEMKGNHNIASNSPNMLNVNFSESSVEIDYNADHLKLDPLRSETLRQQIDKINPDKWNNIPFPLVDWIKLILKDLK